MTKSGLTLKPKQLFNSHELQKGGGARLRITFLALSRSFQGIPLPELSSAPGPAESIPASRPLVLGPAASWNLLPQLSPAGRVLGGRWEAALVKDMVTSA